VDGKVVEDRAAQVDLAERTLTLLDGKERRTHPRVHVLPLVPQAFAIVQRLVWVARRLGEQCVWGALHPVTLTHAVERICDAMLADGEAREPVQVRNIRRTCETLLASIQVSKDIRAQLQSHGLSGVQQRPYDRHDYMAENRETLTKWAAHLEGLKAAHAKLARI
jgi:hypothetical protein